MTEVISQQVIEIIGMGFLFFVRIAAALAVLPGLGERVVPNRVKILLAGALTAAVAPALAPAASLEAMTTSVPSVILFESVVGLVLGLSFRFLIFAIQIAGSMAAQSTSLSQVFGNASVEPLPAMGHFLVFGGLALAMLSGFHIHVVTVFIRSYDFFPAGQLPNAADLAQWAVGRVAHAFELAFELAVPFIILSAIYNLALGAINRAMPQLMVAFVGAPLITFGGLAVLFLTAPFVLSRWMQALQYVLENPVGPFP